MANKSYFEATYQLLDKHKVHYIKNIEILSHIWTTLQDVCKDESVEDPIRKRLRTVASMVTSAETQDTIKLAELDEAITKMHGETHGCLTELHDAEVWTEALKRCIIEEQHNNAQACDQIKEQNEEIDRLKARVTVLEMELYESKVSGERDLKVLAAEKQLEVIRWKEEAKIHQTRAVLGAQQVHHLSKGNEALQLSIYQTNSYVTHVHNWMHNTNQKMQATQDDHDRLRQELSLKETQLRHRESVAEDLRKQLEEAESVQMRSVRFAPGTSEELGGHSTTSSDTSEAHFELIDPCIDEEDTYDPPEKEDNKEAVASMIENQPW